MTSIQNPKHVRGPEYYANRLSNKGRKKEE